MDEIDAPMTDAELRMVREHLGLSAEDVALLLGVSLRTVRRWEAGDSPVPDGVRESIEGWEADAAERVGLIVDAVNLMADPVTWTYRTDDEMWADSPSLKPWPARWHRALVARAAQEMPGLVVRYGVSAE